MQVNKMQRIRRIILIITMPIWVFPVFIFLSIYAIWDIVNELLDDWGY